MVNKVKREPSMAALILVIGNEKTGKKGPAAAGSDDEWRQHCRLAVDFIYEKQ
jgi:hypothetical protein